MHRLDYTTVVIVIVGLVILAGFTLTHLSEINEAYNYFVGRIVCAVWML